MTPLLLLFALAAPVASEPVVPTTIEGRAAALTMSVSLPPSTRPTPGRRVWGASVRLRNEDELLAIALRSVAWRHGVPSANWHVPIAGRTVEKRDGTITLDPLAKQLTDLRFEHALLLPGEEIVVPMEIPVRPVARQELVVDYVVVGNDIRDWRTEILLPRKDEFSHALFGAVTTDSLERRSREGGGRALARSTMKEGYLPLGSGSATFHASIECAPGGEAASLTGGLDAREAIERAGFDAERDVAVAWVAPLRAWILVAGGGKAMAVRRSGDGWRSTELGTGWSLSALAHLGADGEGGTRALLRPDVFNDVLTVAKPTYEQYFDAGATTIAPGDLWSVLERARENGLPVRAIAVDPNGFGLEHVLSVGVGVDARGRWLDPAIDP